jgi:hypothetical protein
MAQAECIKSLGLCPEECTFRDLAKDLTDFLGADFVRKQSWKLAKTVDGDSSLALNEFLYSDTIYDSCILQQRISDIVAEELDRPF